MHVLKCAVMPSALHAEVDAEALMCSSQVPDIETGFQFKSDIYEFMNVTLPAAPKRKVLFFLRQHLENRRLHNLPELERVVESYNIPYTCVLDTRDREAGLCVMGVACISVCVDMNCGVKVVRCALGPGCTP